MVQNNKGDKMMPITTPSPGQKFCIVSVGGTTTQLDNFCEWLMGYDIILYAERRLETQVRIVVAYELYDYDLLLKIVQRGCSATNLYFMQFEDARLFAPPLSYDWQQKMEAFYA